LLSGVDWVVWWGSPERKKEHGELQNATLTNIVQLADVVLQQAGAFLGASETFFK
jgi:hypothetical protein